MSHKDTCRKGCSDPPTVDELRRNHGTVEEFTDAVINAIGEISVAEAQAGISSYREDWRRAVLAQETGQ